MVAQDRRSSVVQAFALSRRELLAAIDGLSDEIVSTPALDGWSAKDHLSHIAHMDEIRFFEIQRVASRLQPAWPPDNQGYGDSLNALGVEGRRHLPLREIVRGLELTRSLVLEAIQNAPEEALDQSRYGEYGLDGGAAHEREHAKAIREWRKRVGL